MFEEHSPRSMGHRPEWALSSLRTPGWSLGHPEVAEGQQVWNGFCLLLASQVFPLITFRESSAGRCSPPGWMDGRRLEVPGCGGRGQGGGGRRGRRGRRGGGRGDGELEEDGEDELEDGEKQNGEEEDGRRERRGAGETCQWLGSA